MSTQIERSNATRSKIIAVARSAFARDGYDVVSLEKIAAEAGFTKGALYHHYEGKEALFAAVFSLVSRETIDAAGKGAAKIEAPREHLKVAAMAWLNALESSDARTILLDLGPKALGFARVRALEESVTLQPLLGLVNAVIALLAARLINATLAEVALLRHESGGTSPSTLEAGHAIASVIDGVLNGSR
jgi:AcrR family transcriptional regulator